MTASVPKASSARGRAAHRSTSDGGLGDIFEAFFGQMAGGGGRGRRRGPLPGADAEVSLRLTFAEAAFGARKEPLVRLPVSCETARGPVPGPAPRPSRAPTAKDRRDPPHPRSRCSARFVTAAGLRPLPGLGEDDPTRPCTQMPGRGPPARGPQPRRRGARRRGARLDAAAGGPWGGRPQGRPQRALFVHLSVEADDRFERAGDDLHTTLSIAMTQAVLGCHVDVETLEEPRTVAIAPGTQSGYEIRLKGLGIPHCAAAAAATCSSTWPSRCPPSSQRARRSCCASSPPNAARRSPRWPRRRVLPVALGLWLTHLAQWRCGRGCGPGFRGRSRRPRAHRP